MPLTALPDLPADDAQPATGLAASSVTDAIVRAGALVARGRLVARAEPAV